MIYQEKVLKIKENICKVIVGKDEVIDLVLTSVIANGHVLLEDVPGTGKTMLSKTLARSVAADFNRVSFTPDLLPSDLTGINYYNQKAGEFVFREGPLFGNIILADEINRATPRTQSALLEAMEERQISVDGHTYRMDAPFLVIATQNPIETAGTYPLPEAQLDRFMMKINVGYPDRDDEVKILERFLMNNPLDDTENICSKEDVVAMQKEAKQVYVHPSLFGYIVDIAEATRKHVNVSIGVSPRGSLVMLNAARSYAYLCGRDYVVPEDIRFLAKPVFAHRLVLKAGMHSSNEGTSIVDSVISSVAVPTEDWAK